MSGSSDSNQEEGVFPSLSDSPRTTMSEHLSQTQLAAYSERALHPGALLAIDNHLASCDMCHERLGRMVVPGVAKIVVNQPFDPAGGQFHLEYDQHLEPYVDGNASDIDREIVDSHVALCSKCAADLKDLLAFKQQPIPVVVANEASAPQRRKRWWPQWAFVSNPAWATAVAAIAVLALATPVLWWTTRPSPGPVQVRPVSQATETPTRGLEPSPGGENGHVFSVNSAPDSDPRQPLLQLNDAGGQVILNHRGALEGLQQLPANLKEAVEKALSTHRLRRSPALAGWTTGAANLRSGVEQQSTFAPLAPTDVVIETERPTFRWQALEDAREYVVTVYDARLRQVASSGPVTGTQWTTPNALARGVTYSWQVSTVKDGKTIVSPKPPLPEARFRVLDQHAVVALARLKETAGSSHLAMGVFYWQHGLIADAEREFQALAKANPNSTVVAQLLASLGRR